MEKYIFIIKELFLIYYLIKLKVIDYVICI